MAAGATQILGRIIQARRRRASLLSPELFADPAWDILLQLTLAGLEGRAITAADISHSLSLRERIVLRWIEKLKQDGWIERDFDPLDRARILFQLSPRGTSAMQAWLSEWAESESPGTADDRVANLLERIDRGRRDSKHH